MNTHITKYILFTLVVLLLAVNGVAIAIAQSPDVVITPVVIDEKAKARDIIKSSLTLTNTSNRKLNLYPTVNNIDPSKGEEEFKTVEGSSGRAASLANWIEITRGVVELAPGEEKTIPFIVRVNLSAIPGNYYAQISFYEGSTRDQAEKGGKQAVVMVNLEVLADIKEEIQLGGFFTDSIFFSGDDVLFNYQLENIGNQDVTPEGEIRIYNRKGEEVAAIDANKNGKLFAPDKTGQLASVWNAGSGFGRYKAFLNLNYGKNQRAAIQDTTFFWVIPWKILLGIFLSSMVVVIFFAFMFHRWLERRQLGLAMSLIPVERKTMRAQLENLPYIKKSTPMRLSSAALHGVAMAPNSSVAYDTQEKKETLKKKLFWFFTKKDKKEKNNPSKKQKKQTLQKNITKTNEVRTSQRAINIGLSVEQQHNKKMPIPNKEKKEDWDVATTHKSDVINLRELVKKESKDAITHDHVVDLRKPRR